MSTDVSHWVRFAAERIHQPICSPTRFENSVDAADGVLGGLFGKHEAARFLPHVEGRAWSDAEAIAKGFRDGDLTLLGHGRSHTENVEIPAKSVRPSKSSGGKQSSLSFGSNDSAPASDCTNEPRLALGPRRQKARPA